jgi:hypothetical protein
MSHARGPKRLRHCPMDSGARPTTNSAKQEKRRRRTDGSGASYPRRAVIVMAILVALVFLDKRARRGPERASSRRRVAAPKFRGAYSADPAMAAFAAEYEAAWDDLLARAIVTRGSG